MRCFKLKSVLVKTELPPEESGEYLLVDSVEHHLSLSGASAARHYWTDCLLEHA